MASFGGNVKNVFLFETRYKILATYDHCSGFSEGEGGGCKYNSIISVDKQIKYYK